MRLKDTAMLVRRVPWRIGPPYESDLCYTAMAECAASNKENVIAVYDEIALLMERYPAMRRYFGESNGWFIATLGLPAEVTFYPSGLQLCPCHQTVYLVDPDSGSVMPWENPPVFTTAAEGALSHEGDGQPD